MNVVLLMSMADYSSETVINQTPQRQECDGDLVRQVFLLTAVYFTRLCLNLKLRPHQRQYFYNFSKSERLNYFFLNQKSEPPPNHHQPNSPGEQVDIFLNLVSFSKPGGWGGGELNRRTQKEED